VVVGVRIFLYSILVSPGPAERSETGVILFFGVTVYASLNSRFESIDRVVAVIRGGL
jgi:hypothetical protein